LKKAILITYDKEDIKNEAVGLCDSANYDICHIIQKDFLRKPKYGISEESVKRLEEIVKELRPDVIIYDENLKPSQNYNLASSLQMNILDREALILEIFQSRVTNYESQLQVKLAQMRYEMARAREKVRLAKKGEQPGFLGIGKFEVDVYYNDIKHRMLTLKSKLKKSGKQRKLHRDSRKRQGFKTISLAGYTSAGKTTLFNQLTGEHLQESKKLFTTLSTTTRRLKINQETFLMSDTVGFISKLPPYMIEAFKSTLEELLYTDLILVVIDFTDSLFGLKKKFRSCNETLNDLGVDREKIVYVLNKYDMMDDEEVNEKIQYLDLVDNKKMISLSAKTGEKIPELKKLLNKIFDEKNQNSQDEGLEKIYGN
jgi:GTP-binding protein HflX